MVDSPRPRWNQKLKVRATFPSNKLAIIQNYVESEKIFIHLMDR